MSVPASIDEAVRRLGVPLPARGSSVVQRGYVVAHHRLGCMRLTSYAEILRQGCQAEIGEEYIRERHMQKLVMSVLNV